MKIKTIIFSTILGAVLMFFWGATEWFNPLLKLPYSKVENPAKVNKVLNENMVESGMYLWPLGDATKTPEGNAKDIVYFVAKNDASFYNPNKFMPVEFLTQLIVWFLISVILFKSKIQDYWNRIYLVLLLGGLVGAAFFLPLWNWWGFSALYVVVRWTNLMLGWFLTSLAVSYVFKKYSRKIV
jgi:hypothetical protein